MKTAATPLLIIIGTILCFGSYSVAQDVFPQQPNGPSHGQAMPADLPYYDGIDEGVPYEGAIAGQAPANQHLPAGVETGEGFLIDNGLWDDAAVGPCCSVCGGGCCCPPDWYTEQGIRILTRSRPRDVVIGSSPDGMELTPVLTSRSAAPDVSAIYAMTIGHYFARDRRDRDHFVEFSFWGLNGWKDKAERLGDGDLYSEFAVQGNFLNGFDAADLQSIYYASYTNNYELNGRFTPRGRPDRKVLLPNGKWRHECQPGTYMSYLYGLRFFQEHETFRFHGQSESNGTVYTGDYDVVSHNNLLGFHVGADMTFRRCKWHWGVRAKIGPFINFSDQQSTIDSGPAGAPTFSRRLSAAKHEASLIGETGLFATYRFMPNLIGRASYDFMWVTGMTLAAEQMQFNPNTLNQINTNGTILYHGVSLSMEWLW